MSPLHHLYSPLIDHSPLAVYLSDFEGHIRLTNLAASAMTGFSIDELQSMKVMELDPAFPTLDALQDMWSTLPLNKQIKVTTKHRTKDSGIIDVELHLAKIEVDGETLFYGNARNITQELHVLRELEQNHEMLAKLARQVPGVVYQYRLYTDERSCFPYSSPGMLDIYGHTPEEVREDATPVFLRLHPEDIDRVSKDIFKSAEELSLFECRYRVILPEKGVQWRHSNARPERLSDGSTLWYGIITDITDLKAQEVKYKIVADNTYNWEFWEGVDGELIYVSPSCEKVTGYSAAEFMADHELMFRLIHPEDRAAYDEHRRHVREQPGPDRGQFQIVSRSGEIRHIEHVCQPAYDDNRAFKGIRGTNLDVTESVKAMERIRRLLDIEEDQNKRLRNFTHIVSHNLRSHTANMAGVFGLLEMEEPELMQNMYVGMLKTSADNLGETIVNLNQVLDINLGKNVTWSFHDLHHVAQTAMSSISTLAETKGVLLINDIPEDYTMFVIPAYLDSIVLNLLTNGIKFRGPNRDAYVRLSAQRDGKATVITVEDNGLGIDLSMHGDKVFGLYKTFHQNTDSKGLGLFITKNQVEAMGGTISVESHVDVGTTFIITLPNQKP